MLFDTLSRNAFDIKRQDTLDSLYNDLYNCDLLVIDDLGTEQSTPFALSHLFTVLNERIIRRKSMIISTNLSLPELKERYQDRIFSRITSCLLYTSNPSYRCDHRRESKHNPD